MTPEELTEAKDKLLDRLEEFLNELLGMTQDDATHVAGVSIDAVDDNGGCLRDLCMDEHFLIDGLLDDIAELQHQEEIAETIAAGKKVGK